MEEALDFYHRWELASRAASIEAGKVRDLEAEVERLKAWRPIAEAPRDGSPVLLGYFLEGGGGGDPVVARWHGIAKAWCTGSTELLKAGGYFSPTHFLPVPPGIS